MHSSDPDFHSELKLWTTRYLTCPLENLIDPTYHGPYGTIDHSSSNLFLLCAPSCQVTPLLPCGSDRSLGLCFAPSSHKTTVLRSPSHDESTSCHLFHPSISSSAPTLAMVLCLNAWMPAVACPPSSCSSHRCQSKF